MYIVCFIAGTLLGFIISCLALAVGISDREESWYEEEDKKR
jgi:hypothetical protein